MSDAQPLAAVDEITEQLVAYLDGELAPEECRRVEQRLADDAPFRLRLQQLQQTWDLLDQLPRSDVSDSFTQTTMEVVALAAADDVQGFATGAATRRSLLWLAVTAVTLLAAGLGYYAMHRRVEQPNEQLVRDLPLLENLDLYYHADSVEFLEQLEKAGLFGDDATELSANEEASHER